MLRILRRVKMNLIRQSGRLALKCVVFFLFFTMLFTSIYIDKVSKQLENNILSNYDIYVEINRIEKNRFLMNLEEHLENVLSFTDMYNDLSKNENISYSDMNIINGSGSPIKFVYYQNEDLIFLDQIYGIDQDSIIDNYESTNLYCSLSDTNCNYPIHHELIGVNSNEPLDFHFGKNRLNLGEFFTDEQLNNGDLVCVLPLGLFEYKVENGQIIKQPINNLGDEITVSILFRDKDGIHYYKPYKLKIIGFYSTEYVDNYKIYIPSKTLIGINEEAIKASKENYNEFYSDKSGFIHVSALSYDVDNMMFKFDNIYNLQSFLNHLDKYRDFFPDKYNYYSSIDQTYASISNVLAVSKTIKYIAMICLAVCIVISILILLLDINSRRKEIGILLSMGETFINVIKQFTLELLLISCLAGIGSYISTSKLSDVCIDYLINAQINTEQINSFLPDGHNVDKDSIVNIMEPVPLSESITTMIVYITEIFFVEIGFMIIIIKKIDPKELLKDE